MAKTSFDIFNADAVEKKRKVFVIESQSNELYWLYSNNHNYIIV